MKAPAPIAATLTMSSREVACLTGKAHFHVKRDIEVMLAELSEDTSKFGCIYRDSKNRCQTEYLLDRELTDTLLTGYSAVARRKVVARWHKLEAETKKTEAVALPDFNNPASAARAWADKFEECQVSEQKLALAAPKVAFVNQYVDSTGLKGFREIAKLLNVNEARFREFLENEGIMYRLGGTLTAYKQHLDAGRFAIKTGICERSGHVFNQAMFTTKGVEWIAGRWASHQLRENGG